MRIEVAFPLAVIVSSVLSGCATQLLGNPDCVKVVVAHPGDTKSIENVGVVIFDRFVTAVQIDGQYKHKFTTLSASCGALQGANLNEQLHLTPGVHVLQLVYAEGANGSFTKNWTPFVVQISAGNVFQIKSVLNEKRTSVSFVGVDAPDQKEFVVKRFNEVLAINNR